ncbi:tripartite tricarboxylate transporter TctB family protein [Hominifimenecus sp. rT4P-3]|uniref:tripartite tricarboxylate transporter TctB family protein n=1 Tax=Hominifimenecus sp. rT4P-3 TaxID=3242979 RepID=UPI003DA44C77
MQNKKKKMIPTAVIMAVDAVVFFSIPSQVKIYEEGVVNTRFLPYLVTILIFVCGIADLIRTLREQNEGEEKQYFDKKGTLRVLIAVAALAVWLLVMPKIGFVIATALLSAGIMLLAGNRSAVQILSLSLILTLSVYALFKLALNLRLPQGLFFF